MKRIKSLFRFPKLCLLGVWILALGLTPTHADKINVIASVSIIGAVIPSATTEAADPSAQQIADLLNIIKANGVHAIFSENMSNPKLAQTLSQEAGVHVGPELYTDVLGPVGSDGETYLKMIKYNVGVFQKYLK